MAQSAALVNAVASGKQTQTDDIDIVLNSLFIFDADDAAGIYQSKNNLALGIEVLAQVLGSGPGKDQQNILRYMMNLLNLQAQLNKHPGILDVLSTRLKQIERNIELHPEQGNQLHSNLAQLYQDTIGTLGFRIHVVGNPELLQQATTAATIRALLLSGIRAGTLWQQVGGKRWKLIFQRRKIRQLLAQL